VHQCRLSFYSEFSCKKLDGQYEGSTASSASSFGAVAEPAPRPGPTVHTESIRIRNRSPPAPPKDASPRSKRRLPWLRRKQPLTEGNCQTRERVGTMVQTRKGEWRLASHGDGISELASVPTSAKKRTQPTTQKSDRMTQIKITSPKTPARSARSIVVTEPATAAALRPTRHVQETKDDEAQFQCQREVAQASLPRIVSPKQHESPDSRPRCRPFSRHQQRSPLHRLHHVHGAPVTLMMRKHEKLPRGKAQAAQPPPKPDRTRKSLSPAPKLPFTWEYAVSNASSLERALDMAQQRIQNMDLQALCPRPTTASRSLKRRIQQAGHKHHPLLTKESCLEPLGSKYPQGPLKPTVTTEHVKTGTAFCQNTTGSGPQAPSKSKENKVVPRHKRFEVTEPPLNEQKPNDAKEGNEEWKQDQHSTPSRITDRLQSQPCVMKEENDCAPDQVLEPFRKLSYPIQYAAKTPAFSSEPASNFEAVMSEVDVFFETDDAAVDDRDVLRGLHVAVRAAADDLYDALIRNKTGLRIRRFLADLKSIEALDAELNVDRLARKSRSQKRRSDRVKRK
jgi:hypothetical protein